jgi:hypothetical protein
MEHKRRAFIIGVLCLFVLAGACAASLDAIVGVWNIEVDTPIGYKTGQVAADWNADGVLVGTLTLFGNTTSFDDGAFDGTKFSFSGKLKMSFLKIAYQASGTLQGDTVSAVATTKFGDMPIVGKRRVGAGK